MKLLAPTVLALPRQRVGRSDIPSQVVSSACGGHFVGVAMRDRTGEHNSHWRGGVFTGSDGRRFIYMPSHPNAMNGKYVAEYRLLVEQNIGRYLNRNEVIHHLNGNPRDNRLENLAVMSQSDHAKIHNTGKRRGRWAMKYDCCKSCGTSDDTTPVTKHGGLGLCRRCRNRIRELKRQVNRREAHKEMYYA